MLFGDRKMKLAYEEALELLLNKIKKIEDTETVSILEAGGKVLAQDVTAPFDQPPFPRSPLDGYALRSADIKEADKEHPVRLKVIAEEMAGYQVDARVEPGTAIRIMTGAPIPPGADCVVLQEDTDYGEEEVEIYKALSAGQNICEQGEDFKKDTVLLRTGDILTPACIGVIASIGQSFVKVLRRPRVVILSTGDELLKPGEALRPGAIYDSNLPLMQMNLLKWGAEIMYAGNSGDDPENAAALIREYAKKSDLIVTTGGVSVGKKDIMHDVYEILGAERIFWRVSIKPGMPTLAGIYEDTPVVSLSGNPFGVVVTAELFVKPAISRLAGDKRMELTWCDAIMENEFNKITKARRFVRARYDNGKAAVTDGLSKNGTLSTVCHSNCLIDIPAGNGPLKPGDAVKVLMM